MSKKILASLALVLAVVVAKADVMYWQATALNVGQINYQYAILKAFDGNNSEIELYAIDESGTQLTTTIDAATASDGVWGKLPTDFENYSYMIELYSYNEATQSSTLEGVSMGGNPVSYSIIQDFVKSSPMSQIGQAWTPGFTAVPEPTSGLLALIGMGLLALKRKQI